MSQAREPNDSPEERLRQRRLSRLEDIHVAGRELNKYFDRLHHKFDEIEAQMNIQFDELSQKLVEGNQKLDLILLHITGQGNS